MTLRRAYSTRTRELVRYAWHTTQLDGTVTHEDGSSHIEYVYRRDDGTEFINLRHGYPVRRVDGAAVVDRNAKVVRSVDLASVLGIKR